MNEEDRPVFKWHYARHHCDLCGELGQGYGGLFSGQGWHNLLMVFTPHGSTLEFCNSCLHLLGSKAVDAPEEKDTP